MQLSRRKLFGIAGIASIYPVSNAAGQRSNKLILQREWTANAEFAGDIWASQIAAGRGITLEVHEGSNLMDPIKRVRSGAAHFGVASSDRILRENEAGAELAVVAAATYRTPVVFLTKEERNIKEPRDFIGRTVGIQPGTNTELVFHALAKAQEIPLKDMRIVDSGWGTQLFERGTVDVLGAFAYDEPITLELKKHPIGKTIVPEDYGIRYVGTVYFTRRAHVANHSEIVQAFMDALVEGWKNALARPSEAMDLLQKKFQSVRNNIAKERRSFDVGREYFSGERGNILYASKERWTDMADSLQGMGKLRSFDFNATVDYRFLEKATAK